MKNTNKNSAKNQANVLIAKGLNPKLLAAAVAAAALAAQAASAQPIFQHNETLVR